MVSHTHTERGSQTKMAATHGELETIFIAAKQIFTLISICTPLQLLLELWDSYVYPRGMCPRYDHLVIHVMAILHERLQLLGCHMTLIIQ